MFKARKKSLNVLTALIVLTALFVLTVCDSTSHSSLDEVLPDTVLINGNIITVDKEDSLAEAVAIKDKTVIAVGTTKTVRAMIGMNTLVVDLKGLTATPGLIDSHCHFAMGGTGLLYVLDLSYPHIRRIADVLEQIKARAGALKPGEWIYGRGWDEGKLEDLRYIYASDLDVVSPDNPVWLKHTMGHYGTANSYALRLAKITGGTADPFGGTIDRDTEGMPTGVLKESAMDMITQLIPPFSAKQTQAGIIKISEEFNKAGMTAVKDPGIGMSTWESYQDVLAQEKLTVRTFILWTAGPTVKDAQRLIKRVGPFTKPYISTGDDLLISGGIKIYLDGSGGARTAWLYDDWNKNYKDLDTGNKGYPVIDPLIFKEQIQLFHDSGLHIGVHAIGDKAIDWTVDAYAKALSANPTPGLRHGIIHCNIPTDSAIAKIEEMQKNHDAGFPEAQATFMWWIGDTYAGNFGPQRCLRLKPFKTYLDRGVIWGGGSDYYVTPFPARYGLWASVARQPLQGIYGSDPYGKEEAIDVHAALRSYTIWNARLMFMEDKIGSIEVGKYADIAVWDKDLYSIPVDDIKDLKCQMTLLGGRIVFKASDAHITFTTGKISDSD